MLLNHAIHKTFDDFEQVYEYHFDDKNGTLIETDKELKPGQVVILRDVNDYAIIIETVWEKDGKQFFPYDTAEKFVVRGRLPRNRD